MRATEPLDEGVVERDGVSLYYEVYGEGTPTIVLLPTWSIIHSRFWKAQIPYLSRHYRVLAWDGRGTGRSSRPEGSAAYTHLEFAADTVAVMDATGTGQAIVMALSCGTLWGVQLAADQPERVLGLVSMNPAVPLAPALPEREVYQFDEEYQATEGWAKHNAATGSATTRTT